MANTNLKEHPLPMDRDRNTANTNFMIILKICHSNDTKRSPWVVLCSLFLINDSSGYLHTTVYLEGMLQDSWHSAEGNSESKGLYIKSWWIANFITPTFPNLSSMVSQSEYGVVGTSSFPQ